MSRHRFLKRLQEDDLYDDFDDNDEDDDQDWLRHEQTDEVSNQIAANFVDGKLDVSSSGQLKGGNAQISAVQSVLGYGVSEKDIQKALGRSNNNAHAAIALLLDHNGNQQSDDVAIKSFGGLSVKDVVDPTRSNAVQGATAINENHGQKDAPVTAPLKQTLSLTSHPLKSIMAQAAANNSLRNSISKPEDVDSTSLKQRSLLSMRLKSMLSNSSGISLKSGPAERSPGTLLASGTEGLVKQKDSSSLIVEKALAAIIAEAGSPSLMKVAHSAEEPIAHDEYTALAQPSPFASFWMKSPTGCNVFNAGLICSGLEENAGDLAAFQFDTFSPDDIVSAARSRKVFSAGIKLQKQDATDSASKELGKGGVPNREKTNEQQEKVLEPQRPPPVKSAIKRVAKVLNVIDEYRKRSGGKEKLSLVVIGHVDAGKSTIMGHLLYLLGTVDDRTMKRLQRDSERMKKSSFAYAWVLDATEEERSRGVTIDVAVSQFETKTKSFTLLDAPGHRDFVPNMISGASQADVALLVIDSNNGEFEAGFEAGGQTREHALLVRSLGVQQLVIAVNKLDTSGWSQRRFEEIEDRLKQFLVSAGFSQKNMKFVPTSGYTGENLVTRDVPLLSWYTGSTLLDCLDALEPPVRALESPFRLCILDYFKGSTGSGSGGSVTVCGRIDAGYTQVGENVLLMPIQEIGVVKAINISSESVKWAVAGDNVMLSLGNIDIQQVNTKSVLCHPEAPIPVTDLIKAKIITFDLAIPLTIGVPVVLHLQGISESATISKLVSLLHKSTGEVVKKNPRALTKNVTAVIEIKLARPMCIETVKDCKELGRFTLRSSSTVVAAGIVTEIINRLK